MRLWHCERLLRLARETCLLVGNLRNTALAAGTANKVGGFVVTLAKRATPSQARVMRIIEGAVYNAADAHGDPRDTWMAKSIAKRAAGTLSAQWPEVLAVSTRLPANGSIQALGCRACERRQLAARLRERRERTKGVAGPIERRAFQLLKRPPLLILWERIAKQMRSLREIDVARYAANVETLRMIHALRVEIESQKL